MQESRDFKRALGPWSAAALVVGTIIGTGIFLFVSDVANVLRNPWLILCAWAAGGGVAALGALCLAELASTYPQTGGMYVYLRRAFGRFVAFEFAWMQFFIFFLGSYCILVLAFAKFTTSFLSLNEDAFRIPIAIGALWVLCVINIFGVVWGGGVQNVLTFLKVISLIAVVAVALLFGSGFLGKGNLVEIPAANPAAQTSVLVAFGLAMIAVMWTFAGWDMSPFIAEEVINPEKNLPLSIVGGLLGCAFLYVLANAGYLMALSPSELAASGGRTAPLVMERALGTWASKGLSLVLMISAIGSANGLILTGPRIAYASGRDNAVFTWFARTHHVTKTPIAGLVAQAVMGTIVILLLDDPFKLLLYTGLGYWSFAALIPVTLIILRHKDGELRRPFRVPFYPVIPILFILAAVSMAGAVLYDDITRFMKALEEGKRPVSNTVVTLMILLAGAIVYFAQNALGKRVRRAE